MQPHFVVTNEDDGGGGGGDNGDDKVAYDSGVKGVNSGIWILRV